GLPADRAGRRGHPEDRAEQHLRGAAAGADDEVGAPDRAGERLAHADAQVLDADQQRHGARDARTREQRDREARPQRTPGQRDEEHQAAAAVLSRLSCDSATVRPKRSASERSWLTNTSVLPTCRTEAKSSSRKRSRRSASRAEVGSSQTMSSGAPI